MKQKFFLKTLALATSFALFSAVSLIGCSTSTTVSSLPTSSIAAQSTGELIKPTEKTVTEGMEGLSLEVLYETTGPWEDAIAATELTDGLTFEGESNRAFIRVNGVTENVYQNIMLSLQVARKDGASPQAFITPLNLGGALPLFVLSYAQDTDVTDYTITITGENIIEDQTRALEIPAMKKENIVTEGMAFPGDLVKINDTIYYYTGPERTKYEIGTEGVEENLNGFSLTGAVSLVNTSQISTTQSEWKNENIFTNENLKMVDPETKKEANWPTDGGYTVVLNKITPLDAQYILNPSNLNIQTALGTVAWAKTEQVESSTISEDDIMALALDYFLQVAFEYTGEKSPIYFMSSDSYYNFNS